MPENILNQIQNKSFSYEELKGKWNEVKTKKDSEEKAFLGGIFGFDEKKPDSSVNIFKTMAASDGDNKTISAKDIEIFSHKDRENATSIDDFEHVYRETFGDDYSFSKFGLEEKGINPYFKFDKATNKYKDKNEVESDYKRTLNQTKSDLEKYVQAHPEDSQAAAYLKEFKKVNISLSCEASDEAQGHFYHNTLSKNKIILNYFNYNKNERDELCKTLFHEMGHSVESHKDNIVSKQEERDVEDAAIIMTRKLYGNDCFKDLNKEKYLNEFENADAYKDKPTYSPGHGL